MRQAVTFSRFGGPEVMEVSKLPVPDPGPGEVRIRVAVATVNPTDIGYRTGRHLNAAQLAEIGVTPPVCSRHGAGGRRRRRRHRSGG